MSLGERHGTRKRLTPFALRKVFPYGWFSIGRKQAIVAPEGENIATGQRRRLGRGLVDGMGKMGPVFDTAFHNTMPDRASNYAIPLELATKYGIRCFGFH